MERQTEPKLVTQTEPALSVVIPSFKRRDSLVRLVRQLATDHANDAIEVVVVIDGSDDGTIEALTELRQTVDVPLRWYWQPNRGRSAARNVGIRMALGSVCWLLDDDVVPSTDTLAGHRRFHAMSPVPAVLVGPTWEAGPQGGSPAHVLERHQRLVDNGQITQAADFWSGNFSSPRSVLLGVGGFDTGFSGWGVEDVEFGYRLLKAGIPIHYDPLVDGYQHSVRGPRTVMSQQRDRGRNLVHLTNLHPEAVERPPIASQSPRMLSMLFTAGIRSRWPYLALAAIAGKSLTIRGFHRTALGRRFERLGMSAARLAGLIEGRASAPVLRAFGFPKPIAPPEPHRKQPALSAIKGSEFELSIVIPTFQRRAKLLGLLKSLEQAMPTVPTEVVVVVDGSTDGTVEALLRLQPGYPLSWRWQYNQGQATARNAGIEMARGRVCWLIDDDKTVTAESLAAHARFHKSGAPMNALMGPTWEGGADPFSVDWSLARIERLATAGTVEHPTDFRAGNVSIARDVLIEVGGFSTAFTGWGEEDVELGYRLDKHGVKVYFDSEAATWHDRARSPATEIRQERDRGRNLVALIRMHPESLRRPPVAGPTPRLLISMYQRGIRSARVYGAISDLAAKFVSQPLIGDQHTRTRAWNLGKSAARLAGLIEAGGTAEVVQTFGFPQR